MSSTMPGGGDQLLVAMHEVQRAWPSAGSCSAVAV